MNELRLCKGPCGQQKSVSEFTKCKANKDGLHSMCKVCKNELQRKKYSEKKVVVTLTTQICNDCSAEKEASEFNTYRASTTGLRKYCKKCQSKRRKEYHNKEENKKKSNEQSVSYYENNKDKVKERVKNNQPKRNEKYRERYKNDEQFRLHCNLHSHLTGFIKNSPPSSYSKHLKCTKEFLVKWIEFQLDEGMNWDNYGKNSGKEKYWEIEHIIGYWSFDLTNENERLLCTHWTNLQVMWAEDNKKKRNRFYLYQYMNSIVTAHRFILYKKENFDAFDTIKQRNAWVKTNQIQLDIVFSKLILEPSAAEGTEGFINPLT